MNSTSTNTDHKSVHLTGGVEVTVGGRFSLRETRQAPGHHQPSGQSAVWPAGGVAGRLADLQVRGRSHLTIVSPHSPDIEELALLDHDQAEDQQHHPAHCGEEADEDSLYDGLVQLAPLLPGPRAHVVLVLAEGRFKFQFYRNSLILDAF